RTPTPAKPPESRQAFAPWWQSRSAFAPCLRKKEPGPGLSSSALGPSRRSSRPCRHRRSLALARKPVMQRVPRRWSERGAGKPVSCHPLRFFLECIDIRLAGSNAHGAFDRHDENLAIADLAGAGGCGDHFDDLVQLLAGDRDFEAKLGQKIHLIFGAAIDFRMSLFPAVAFHCGHRHSVNADSRECITHLIELEWFYDSDDDLHG